MNSMLTGKNCEAERSMVNGSRNDMTLTAGSNLNSETRINFGSYCGGEIVIDFLDNEYLLKLAHATRLLPQKPLYWC